MRNLTKCLIGSFLFPFIYTASYGAVIFVDKNLSSNCLSGNYSIAGRNCSGADGNAYSTIQSALNSMNGGDDIYMRGGTYDCSGSVTLPTDKNGYSGNYSSIKSYTGEWAILDGKNSTNGNSPIDGFVIGRNAGLSYWEISHIEIKNGRAGETSNKAGGIQYGGNYGHFHNLYIHDNYPMPGHSSPGSNNPAGIRLQHTQNVTIEYNYLFNNGIASGNNDNCANITMESDYIEFPERVVLSKAMRSTNIQYNLVEASSQGIKDKNNQFLSRDHTGTEMSWSEYGNKIHHNIIKNPRNRPVMMESDFVQIYNNIMDLSNQGYTSSRRADLHHWDDGERVYFHNCFYNNTLIRTRVETEHFYDSTSVNSTHNTSFKQSVSDPINPYHYFYNNIFYDVGKAVNGRLDLNIIWNYGALDVDTGVIDMSTVFVERNLFIPRLPSTKVIVVGASSDTFSIADYFNRGWATKNYAQSSTSGLFSTGYKTNGSFSLGGLILSPTEVLVETTHIYQMSKFLHMSAQPILAMMPGLTMF